MNIHDDIITEYEEMEQTFLSNSLYLNGHFSGTKQPLYRVTLIKQSGAGERLRFSELMRFHEMLRTLSLHSLVAVAVRHLSVSMTITGWKENWSPSHREEYPHHTFKSLKRSREEWGFFSQCLQTSDLKRKVIKYTLSNHDRVSKFYFHQRGKLMFSPVCD